MMYALMIKIIIQCLICAILCYPILKDRLLIKALYQKKASFRSLLVLITIAFVLAAAILSPQNAHPYEMVELQNDQITSLTLQHVYVYTNYFYWAILMSLISINSVLFAVRKRENHRAWWIPLELIFLWKGLLLFSLATTDLSIEPVIFLSDYVPPLSVVSLLPVGSVWDYISVASAPSFVYASVFLFLALRLAVAMTLLVVVVLIAKGRYQDCLNDVTD